MKKIIKAPAKINLCLKVDGKRDDGYHDLIMIMQPISLFDSIEIEIIKERDINKKGTLTYQRYNIKKLIKPSFNYNTHHQITLKCNFSYIPTDEKNLVVKITKYFFEKYNIKDKVFIYLKKMIPTCGGLGGGSSDAASILLFLNEYYKTNLSKQELNDISIQFGSDIPFFLYKKECLCEGRGEIITELNSFNNYYILIVTPNIRVSTRDIFEKVDDVSLDNKKLDCINNCIDAINNKNLKDLSSNIFNDLEAVTIPIYNEILDLKNVLIKNGALSSMMSGSGPTIFGIFDSYFKAKMCKKLIKNYKNDAFVYIAKPI